LSSYVAGHSLAVAVQSSAKGQFYSTIYYITLNQIFAAPRVSKNLKKMCKTWLEAKINRQVT
jgi:hypothetical protein